MGMEDDHRFEYVWRLRRRPKEAKLAPAMATGDSESYIFRIVLERNIAPDQEATQRTAYVVIATSLDHAKQRLGDAGAYGSIVDWSNYDLKGVVVP